MAKKSPTYILLFLLMVSMVSACQTQQVEETQQTQPTISSNDVVGIWSGNSQWMCGRGDPAWITTMEFTSDGSFGMLMTDPNGMTVKGNGTWSLSGNNIKMNVSTNVWSGTVSDGKMEGTFKDERDPCTGNWSVAKN